MKRSLLVVVVVGCGGGKPAPISTAPAPEPAPVAAAPTPAPPPAPPPTPAGHPRNDLIPRSILFGNPERAAVRISHDGKHLSWLAAKDGVLNVWVAPRDHLDQAKPVTSDTTRPIRQYFWAEDSKHVLYLQDTGGDENYHLFRTDLDGKTTDLTPGKGARVDVIALSDRKPNLVAVTINDRDPAAMDLYTIDITSGKRTLLVQNTDHLSGFQLDPDLRVALATKPTPDGGSQWLTPKGKDWAVFDTIAFEDASGTNILDVAPGGKLVYATDSRGRDTSALVQIDLATRKTRVLADDARADAGDIISHPTRHAPRAIAFDPGRTHWRAIEKSMEDDLAALKKLAGDADFSVGSMSNDDRTWIVTTESPQQAPHYFLYDHAKHAGTLLFSARPELDKQPLAAMDVVTIPARDGLPLVSYLTRPKDAKGPVPLVLFPHGGPWGRDSWGYNPFTQLLANRGYAVLQPNFRSSTGFGKKFFNAGNQQWGKAMQTDLDDAVAWAIAQGVTTKDQVGILGGSYGGYATLEQLTTRPEVYRCGVDLFGPANILTLIATIPPYWAPVLAAFKRMIGDWDSPEGKQLLVEASPLTHAADIRRPLLIAQGANDARVKPAESEQIVTAMKQHHLPVTYVVFPDEGHGFARPENNIAFWAIAEAFLSAHLGGSYQPITNDELKASSLKMVDGAAGIPGLPR